ncbi:MAG: GNAT family N-acetyltransferase [Eubacteriales bacterium]|nr:GNAT family N-acetyltransferase [Eubacteriales bacterium]
MTKQEERALSWLMRDRIWHADMIETLRRSRGEVLYAEEDGVILREKLSGTVLMAVLNPERLSVLYRELGLDKAEQLSVKGKEAAALLQEAFARKIQMSCFNGSFQQGRDAFLRMIPDPENLAKDIRLLTPDYTELVFQNYDMAEDSSYVSGRIAEKKLWGLFEKNGDREELAGFAGIHSEGSMGLLEVLPAYRRKGYAMRLEQFLIGWHLEHGLVPFCQIVIGNEASIALQKKLGIELSEAPMHWME